MAPQPPNNSTETQKQNLMTCFACLFASLAFRVFLSSNARLQGRPTCPTRQIQNSWDFFALADSANLKPHEVGEYHEGS